MPHRPRNSTLRRQSAKVVLTEHAEAIGRQVAQAVDLQHWERCRHIVASAEAEAKAKRDADPRNWPIVDLGLSPQLTGVLNNQDLIWVRDLIAMTPSALMQAAEIGVGHLADIEAALAKVGLALYRRRR